MTGDVLVGDRPITKPGAEVPADAEVRLRTADSPYVSRGGEKLAGALDAFGLEVRDPARGAEAVAGLRTAAERLGFVVRGEA